MCSSWPITLGALAFVMIQHLTRAGWSVTVRRVAEGLSLNMFLLVMLTVVFFIPVHGLDGVHRLFPHWFYPDAAQHDAVLRAKAGYLNPQFFAIRMGVCFAGVVPLGVVLFRQVGASRIATRNPGLRAADGESVVPGDHFLRVLDDRLHHGLGDGAEPALVHHGLRRVLFFAGCMLSGLSAMVLLLLTLQQRGRIGPAVNDEHYQDLGKLMFAFTFFWGYIAFSQYMLIWYANMPEETQFYIPRQWEHWAAVSLILLVVHLLIPFPGLLSEYVKRRERVLAFWAVWSIWRRVRWMCVG